MASRFLRRSKAKPALNTDQRDRDTSITYARPGKPETKPAGAHIEKGNLPVLAENAKSLKAEPQGPRSILSTQKSAIPKALKSPGNISAIAEVIKAAENTTSVADMQESRLRRKPSSADNRSLYARSKSHSSSRERPQPPSKHYTVSLPEDDRDQTHEMMLGISIPTAQSATLLPSTNQEATEFATSSSRMANFMSTQLPHKLSTYDLAPPTLGFATKSSSASTRCSTTSPSPFSRVSTPTSTSSYSPAIQPSAGRAKQTPSPARPYPPVTRRRGTDGESHELSVLEELSIRSSLINSSPDMEEPKKQALSALPSTPSGTMSSKIPTVAPIPPLRSSSKRLPRPKAEPVSSTLSSSSKGAIAPSNREKQVSESAKATLKRRVPLADAFENPRQPPPLPKIQQNTEPVKQTSRNLVDQSHAIGGRLASDHTEAASIAEAPPEPPLNQTHSSLLRSPTAPGSRIPTRSPLINSNGVPAVKPPFRSATPSKVPTPKVAERKKLTKSSSIDRTDSPGKTTGRMNIFSRRARLGSNGAEAEPPLKKGPAAGTGHEGYGKYARRGRTSSIGTASIRGRSTSDESGSELSYGARTSRKSSFASQSGSDLDDFYKERLEPVIIRGGTPVVENEESRLGLSGVDSRKPSLRADSSVESLPASSSSHRTPMKLGLPVSPRDTDVMKRFPQRASTLQGPVDSQLSGVDPAPPTLAARRSFNRSQLSKTLEPLKVPSPIDVSGAQVSPSLGSFETIVSAAPMTESSIFSDDILEAPTKGSWSKAKRLLDRAIPSKASFFRRMQGTLNKLADNQAELEAQEVFAAVTEIPDYRAVAHYCMLDNPDQEVKQTLDDLLHEIEDDLELRRSYDVEDREFDQSTYREPSVLLPSPPQMAREFPSARARHEDKTTQVTEEMPSSVFVRQPRSEPALLPRKDESEPMISPAKSPRLAQVGRIPKVISKKDHMHKPPARSFSRPFPREEYPSVAHVNLRAETNILKAQGVDADEPEAMSHPKKSDLIAESAVRFSPEKEFVSTSPRKRSGLSGSTNSSEMLDFSAITAVRPDSTASLDEDEIWNEYDELFDRAVFPYTAATGFSLATEPSLAVASQTLIPRYNAMQDSATRRESRLSNPISPRSTTRAQQLSSALSDFPTPPPPSTNTPKTVEFAEPKPLTRLNSTSSRKSHHSHLSKSNSQSSRSSRRSTRPQTLSQIIERKSRHSDSSFCRDLRYHAVVMSQYLSFSRVLFSPIHTEVSTHMSDRVLILDGLGNDDWSLYCALKYPEAVIYNLGSSRPLSGWRRDSVSSTSLPNHRQIQHIGIDHPFPFPKGFFAAVVWRFPTTGSEAGYYNAISEAKRVLRPGGYLELTVLDMDPVNMGNIARRAVKGLKVSMLASNPDISLAPAGDCIQKMLGRKGFENMSRCVVGIPVVGGFGDNRPSDCSDANQGSTAHEQRGFDFGTNNQDITSLDDASIFKMVGSVGRWWWARCFEQWESKTYVTGDSEPRMPSIWDEPTLLEECEQRETSFKLLLCYAQKPAVTRRRTVSV